MGFRSFPTSLILLLLVSLGAWDEARSQDAGSLRGVILDEDFDTPVAGAVVTLEGADGRAESDENGTLLFPGLPPGTYRVLASRDGFLRGRSDTVVVRAGEISDVTLRLTADVVDLDEFVVTGEEMLDSPEIALVEIRQDAASFTDVLGAEFISRLGASDAGKALQKTAGVSLAGDRYIVVRGLADRYNAVLLNGTPVPSSDPDKRAVNIDLFPASIIQNLQTAKTFTPDLPGEGTGATIDIISKGVPEKTMAKVKVGTGYNTLTTGSDKFRFYQGGGTGMFGTLDDRRLPAFVKNSVPPARASLPGEAGAPTRQLLQDSDSVLARPMGTRTGTAPFPFTAEITLAKRGEFFGAPAGVLAAFDYRKSYGSDVNGFSGRYTYGPDGTPFDASRRLQVDVGRETLRASSLIVAGIEPRPTESIKLTYFSNLSAEDRATLRTGPGRTPIPQPPAFNPDYLYRESLAYTERYLGVLQFAGRKVLGEIEDERAPVLNWAATYSQSSQDEPDHRFVEMLSNPALDTFGFPGSFDIPPFRRYWRSLEDSRYNLSFDYEQLLFGTKEKGIKFQFGGGYDHSSRDYVADSFAYNDKSLEIANKVNPPKGFTFGQVLLYGNRPITSFADTEQALYVFRFTPEESYKAKQDIPSAFVNFHADVSENFGFDFGFRVEQTNIDIAASDFVDIAEDEYKFLFLSPEERLDPEIRELLLPANINKARADPRLQYRRYVDLSEVHVLPALSGNWDISDNARLRGAFSRTVARPSFKEIAPVLIRDAETSEVFLGNRDLQVSDVTNYDLRWEWTPQPGTLAAISVFSKTITDTIEKTFASGVEQFANTGTANVHGFELEADTNLGFIDPSLKDFGIGANYSFISSSIERTDASIFGATRRLQGQPDYLFNFNLTYNNDDIGFDAGLFLNVTGQYLDAVGQDIEPDVYVRPATTLDAALGFRVGQTGKLTLRAANLTNERHVKYFDTFGTPLHTITNRGVSYALSYEQTW